MLGSQSSILKENSDPKIRWWGRKTPDVHTSVHTELRVFTHTTYNKHTVTSTHTHNVKNIRMKPSSLMASAGDFTPSVSRNVSLEEGATPIPLEKKATGSTPGRPWNWT